MYLFRNHRNQMRPIWRILKGIQNLTDVYKRIIRAEFTLKRYVDSRSYSCIVQL